MADCYEVLFVVVGGGDERGAVERGGVERVAVEK